MDLKNIKTIAKVKVKLTTVFKIVDIGLIDFYLRFWIDKNCKINYKTFTTSVYLDNLNQIFIWQS